MKFGRQILPPPITSNQATTASYFSSLAATVSTMSAELSNQIGAASPMSPTFGFDDPDATGSPSIKTAAKCIKANINSINRANELSHPSDQYSYLNPVPRMLALYFNC